MTVKEMKVNYNGKETDYDKLDLGDGTYIVSPEPIESGIRALGNGELFIRKSDIKKNIENLLNENNGPIYVRGPVIWIDDD